MTPDITVVLPTRDRSRLLSGALASALAQSDVALEVVIVDDGSVDGTQTMLAHLTDPRAVVIRHDEPAGVARARNAGIARARGKWVAFLDDDDVWAPHKLRTQLDRATDTRASFVFSSAVAFDSESGVTRALPAGTDTLLPHTFAETGVGPPSTVIVLTELARKLGGFDANLSMIADLDLWMRLADHGFAVACDEVLVGYRLHQDSMCATIETAALRREYTYLAAKHRLPHHDPDLRRRYASTAAWAHRRAGRRAPAAAYYVLAGLASRKPADFQRAFGVLLGERAMAFAGRRRPRHDIGEVDWLPRPS